MYRDDGERVSVYSEGLTVYLFDEAALETVRDVLETSRTEGAESQTLLDLAASGTLVMYELWQDDPIDVEVALGDPLTAAEKKPAKWMRVVRVPIDLPSGRLRIESGGSLDDATTTPGGVVNVPAGKYELALHRVNWGKMEGRKYQDYDGPGQVLTLRPWPPKKKFKPNAPCIYCGDEPRAPWVGQYEIADGVFRGAVISSWKSDREKRLNINLDVPAYAQLALERGLRLELTTAGRSYVVLCQGRMIPLAAHYLLGDARYAALAELHERLLVGFASSSGIPAEPGPSQIGEYRDYDYFVVSTITNETEAYTSKDDDWGRVFELEPGASIELRVLPEPFFVLDRALMDDWRVEDRELHCRVVFCSPTRLYLNADVAALRKAGFQDGDTLQIDLADQRRYVFDRGCLGGGWFDVLERATLAPLASDVARAEELSAQVYDKNGQIQKGEGWEDKVVEIHELEIHPEDRANPPLVLGFDESTDFPGSLMMVCQSAFFLGPLSPAAIHIDASQGTPVVIRRIEDEVVRR